MTFLGTLIIGILVVLIVVEAFSMVASLKEKRDRKR